MTSDAEETVVSVAVQQLAVPPVVTEIQYSTER